MGARLGYSLLAGAAETAILADSLFTRPSLGTSVGEIGVLGCAYREHATSAPTDELARRGECFPCQGRVSFRARSFGQYTEFLSGRKSQRPLAQIQMDVKPWPSPPPCNSNNECIDLLISLFPANTPGLGQAECFPALGSNQSFIGGCDCDGMYGLGGITCGEQTSATPSSLALAVIAGVAVALTVAWFLPTLVYVCCRANGKNRVLKLNAVGLTYMATWLALVCLMITVVSHILLSLYSSPALLALHRITYRIGIVVLGTAILNLVAVIVELSITMKAISNIERYRFRVIALVLAVAISLTITYLVLRSADQAYVQYRFSCIVCGSARWESAVQAVWVFVQLNSSRATPEATSPRGEPSSPRMGEPSQSPSMSVHSVSSPRKNHNQDSEHQQDKTVIKFFTRAYKLGVWLGHSLLICAIGTGILVITLSQYTTDRLFSLAALGTALSEIGMVGCAYQLLWFLDESFTRSKKKHLQIFKTAGGEQGEQDEQARRGGVQAWRRVQGRHWGGDGQDSLQSLTAGTG
ncbi:hypothetical protein BASA81_002913 [Batrachochytrium salamandrivorans]|nr:hypothetical protein BASA81_002913 [Batrachochytrium salamandrivorans]